jgi:hypothetical protein
LTLLDEKYPHLNKDQMFAIRLGCQPRLSFYSIFGDHMNFRWFPLAVRTAYASVARVTLGRLSAVRDS